MRHRNEIVQAEIDDMTWHHGEFVWYELLTTDVASAEAFYCNVMGWGGRDASTETVPYRLLTDTQGPMCGLMGLPPEASANGATPRWVGYVAVDDIDAAVDRLKAGGGRVFVPPTKTNIGKLAIVADPQTATLALVQGLTIDGSGVGKPGRAGWHELLAADWRQAFAFYSALLGWQRTGDNDGPLDDYQLFTICGHVRGGVFNKLPRAPFPFWLYYFDVDDLGQAVARVVTHGGRVVQGPIALPDGVAVARCIDPQGGMFALQGRSAGVTLAAPAEIGWTAEWGGFASRGRIVTDAKSPPAKTRSGAKPAAPKRPAPKR